MLNFELVQAPLAYGLAEGIDPHQAPFGTLMTAENVRWTRTGRLEKRSGLTGMPTAPANLVRLFVRGAELSGIDANGVVYSRTAVNTWVSRYTTAPMLTVTRTTACDTVNGMRTGDLAVTSDGLTVFTWVEGAQGQGAVTGGKVYVRKTDRDGSEVQATTLVFDGTGSPTGIISKVIAIGTDYYVFYVSSGSLYVSINGATPLAALFTDVWSSLSYGPYDVVSVGSTALITYFNGTNIKSIYYTFPAGIPTAGTTTSFAPSAAVPNISMDAASSDYVYIAYSSIDNKTAFAILNAAALTTAVAPTVLEASIACLPVIGRTGAGTALVAWASPPALTATRRSGETRYAAIGINAPTQGGQKHASGVLPVTKPFVIGARVYLGVTTALGTTGQRSGDVFLLDVTTPKTAGVVAPPPPEAAHIEVLTGGNAGNFTGASIGVSKVVSYSGKWYALTPFASSFGAFAAAREGKRLLTITAVTTTDTSLRPLKYGPEVYFTGAVVPSYDGNNIVPAFGAVPPTINGLYSAAVAGGGPTVGAYAFNTHSERRNAAGVLHRSPTGVGYFITTTGGNALINLSITPTWVGASTDATGAYGSDILIPIFMNQLGSGVLQRWTQDGITGVLLDTYTTGTDFAQAIGSAVQPTAPAIYTASGELDDYQPPASLFMTEHQSRIWSIGLDGYTVWFSKDSTVNPGVAPGFHPSLTIAFNEPIVALMSMDAGLVAFTSTGIYLVQGDGPSPNGQGATYQPVKVQTDVGCTNPRSAVSMPDGVMFQSTRGLYLLTRGLEVVFVGKTVQDKTKDATVTTAVLVGRRCEVRFSLSTGTSVIYNYVEKQWSTARYTSVPTYGAVIVDACIWQNAYTVLFADGKVAIESDTSYLDSASWVPMTLETSWYNATGPLGYQSVRNFSLEGFSASDHDLTVSCAFDNETSYSQTATFVSGTEVTQPGPLESLEISIGTRRKCQAIRFKVQDAAPSGGQSTGTGQGPAFDMLGIEVGAKRGFRKKGAGLNA